MDCFDLSGFRGKPQGLGRNPQKPERAVDALGGHRGIESMHRILDVTLSTRTSPACGAPTALRTWHSKRRPSLPARPVTGR
jgi:hypothetical protein